MNDIVYDEKLYSEITYLNSCSNKKLLRTLNTGRYQYLIDEINRCTPLLQTDDFQYSMQTKIFWYINRLTEFPTCSNVTCDNVLSGKNIYSIPRGYDWKYCCKKCASSDEQVKNKIKTTLSGHTIFVQNELQKQRADRHKNKFTYSYGDLSSAISCFNIIDMPVFGLSNINYDLNYHNLIYKLENIQNGHFYIGKHSTINPLDSYIGSGTILHDAELKYGLSSFTKEILFDFEDLSSCFAKEAELIPEISCHHNNFICYNMKPGGIGCGTKESGKKGGLKRRGRKCSMETRLKISMSNKNKRKSQIHKNHLSDNHRSNRTMTYVIEQTGETITEITNINRIAKLFNISNVQLLRRKSWRDEFYMGIKIISIIKHDYVYYHRLSKIDLIYIDPITNEKVSYNYLNRHKREKNYKNIGNIFNYIDPALKFKS